MIKLFVKPREAGPSNTPAIAQTAQSDAAIMQRVIANANDWEDEPAPLPPNVKTWRMPASGNVIYICEDEAAAESLFDCIQVAENEYKQIVCFHGFYNAIEIKHYLEE